MTLVVYCFTCKKSFLLDKEFPSEVRYTTKLREIFENTVFCCERPMFIIWWRTEAINTGKILSPIKLKAKTFKKLKEELIPYSL